MPLVRALPLLILQVRKTELMILLRTKYFRNSFDSELAVAEPEGVESAEVYCGYYLAM
jgi:hypothetical protein